MSCSGPTAGYAPRMRSTLPACLLLAACQIYPSYYPAEVAPFRADDTGPPTSTAPPTGDTAAATTDTGPTITTPQGAVVVTYPTGVPSGPLPCDTADPYVISFVSFDNPRAAAFEVWALADDCTETLAYASDEPSVTIGLPTGGAYALREGGATWLSFVLPSGVVYLTVEVP